MNFHSVLSVFYPINDCLIIEKETRISLSISEKQADSQRFPALPSNYNLMDYCYQSLSVDTTIMVSNKCLNIGKQDMVSFCLHNRLLYQQLNDYSVFYKAWHVAGVEKIRDLFNGNTFLSHRDFCSYFGLKTNFLSYYGLCKAIPPNWIKIVKGKLQPPPNKSISMDRISLEKLSCKLASNFFVERKFVPATAKRRLRKANLNEQQISQIYKMPFSATKDIQLSMFQVKILHHHYIT